MRFRTLYICILLSLPSITYSQYWKTKRYMLSGGICTMHYFGDIGGSVKKNNLFGLKDIDLRSTRFGFQINAAYLVNTSIETRIKFSSGYISGNDRHSKNAERGLSFISRFFELLAVPVFHLSKLFPGSSHHYNRKGHLSALPTFSPYVTAGIGFLHFKPETGPSYQVIKRMTSARKNEFDSHAHTILSLPLGIGFAYSLNNDYSFSAELTGRYLFNDYIDGFASAFSSSNDICYSLSLSVIYKIRTSRRGLPVFRR